LLTFFSTDFWITNHFTATYLGPTAPVADRFLGVYMSRSWAAFAATGDPNNANGALLYCVLVALAFNAAPCSPVQGQMATIFRRSAGDALADARVHYSEGRALSLKTLLLLEYSFCFAGMQNFRAAGMQFIIDHIMV
jgi:hypothetical protein